MADRIVVAARLEPGSWVVEVGPGRGALTRPLLGVPVAVLALELDGKLAEELPHTLPPGSLRVVVADAVEADFAALLAEAGAPLPVPLVSNLPYESATPIVRRAVRRPDVFSRLVVMVQREVAERMCAACGDEAYGFLSVDVALHARARRLFDVNPGAFRPPPRVVSTVVSLEPFPEAPGSAAGLAVASAAFGGRRKTLLNALSAVWPREEVRSALAAAGVRETARAEETAPAAFCALGALLPARPAC